MTQYLPDRFDAVEATDQAAEMVAQCQARVPEVTHAVRDAWEAPTCAESWDYVVSSSLLQWSEQPEEIVRQWCDLVASRGRLLLGFFVEPSLPELRDVLCGVSPLRWRSPKCWERIFIDCPGVELIRSEVSTRCYMYPDALAFMRSLHQTGVTVSQGRGVGDMRRVLCEYDSRYSEVGGVRATWSFYRVELRV